VVYGVGKGVGVQARERILKQELILLLGGNGNRSGLGIGAKILGRITKEFLTSLSLSLCVRHSNGF
jgi:hypothetical protein